MQGMKKQRYFVIMIVCAVVFSFSPLTVSANHTQTNTEPILIHPKASDIQVNTEPILGRS